MPTPSSIKVVLVTNMLPPYRVSFYAELAKLVDLTVFVDTLSEFNRSWEVDADSLEFDLKVLDSRSLVYTRTRKDVDYREKRQFHFSEKVFSALREVNPDVVVSIEFGLKSLWSLSYGYFHSKPVILLSEGTLHTEGHVAALKATLRKVIVSQVARLWSNGPEATKLLVSYGADPARCDEGMTGIETEEWRTQVDFFIPEREKIRNELGLSGRVFLFSASFTPRKGVKELLAAASSLAEQGETFSLLLLGSGDELDRIEAFEKEYPQIVVKRPGFVQREDLPQYFAAADWAILPTLDDNWPLATLETLVAGLPQIFSVYNGATADLCEEGITGYSCDPLDDLDFVEVWKKALRHPEGRICGKTIERFSSYYSPQSQANRALAGIEKALSEVDKR